jgi:nitrite reductase/ring-hydroxylating ferredoxin subunit
MTDCVEAARLDQVPPGKGISVTVAGKGWALFNVDGTVYTIDDGCLHTGAALGTGTFEDKVVTCRAHGWTYDVTTGHTLHVPDDDVSSYPVTIVDGKSLVALTPSKEA